MELTEVMRTTPATREFTDEPVDDETLARLLEAARFAPSGGNRQPWRVIVVRDAATRAAIKDAYAAGWREYWAHVERGLVPFAPGEDGMWRGPAVDLEAARERPAPDSFGDSLDAVPVMMVLCAHLPSLAVTDNGLGRQSIVGGASVYPFGHNLLLAARDAGLGGVMTTVLCRQEPAMRALLRIPPGHAVAALVVLGHPVKEVRKLRRKAVGEIAVIDRFDGEAFQPGT
jgi:nitroreductase